MDCSNMPGSCHILVHNVKISHSVTVFQFHSLFIYFSQHFWCLPKFKLVCFILYPPWWSKLSKEKISYSKVLVWYEPKHSCKDPVSRPLHYWGTWRIQFLVTINKVLPFVVKPYSYKDIYVLLGNNRSECLSTGEIVRN